MLLMVFAFGAVTQAIGVHLVLGALRRRDPDRARSRPRPRLPSRRVRQVGHGVLRAVLLRLHRHQGRSHVAARQRADFAVVAVVGGVLSAKSWAGGRARGWAGFRSGRRSRSVSGLNARGAMELVIAAIGLSIGVAERGDLRDDRPHRGAHDGDGGAAASGLRAAGGDRGRAGDGGDGGHLATDRRRPLRSPLPQLHGFSVARPCNSR